MVEWRPLLGFLPPMNDTEWNRVYELYKASPEFEKKHFWMNLHDFKQIFFWEWLHRALGRIIGLAYALPLLWFWIRKQIPKGYGLKFFGMFILGSLQGLMGWYMVKSGLVDNPYVSHYRLAAHLSLAFLIFGLLLWLALGLNKNFKTTPSRPLHIHTTSALIILTITIIWGAFTAGLDAGLVYNESFPKMGGHWIPPTLHQYEPYWINLLKTPEGVQFLHRWLAIATVITILGLWAHAIKRGVSKHSTHALAIIAVAQMTLGIVTLLSQVHLPIAVAHQGGALILLTTLLVNLKRFKA